MTVLKLAAITLAVAALAGCGTSGHAGSDGLSPPDTAQAASAKTGHDSLRLAASGTDTTPAPRDSQPAPKLDRPTPLQSTGDAVPARITRRFPEAVAFEARNGPFAHGVVIGSEGIIGYEVDSDEAGTTQDGYGGPVPLLVWFDGRGRVTEVKVLGNDETPGYLDIILKSGLLDSLKGLSAPEPQDVDAVAMATTSSRAIIDGTRLTAERVCRELLRR